MSSRGHGPYYYDNCYEDGEVHSNYQEDVHFGCDECIFENTSAMFCLECGAYRLSNTEKKKRKLDEKQTGLLDPDDDDDADTYSDCSDEYFDDGYMREGLIGDGLDDDDYGSDNPWIYYLVEIINLELPRKYVVDRIFMLFHLERRMRLLARGQ